MVIIRERLTYLLSRPDPPDRLEAQNIKLYRGYVGIFWGTFRVGLRVFQRQDFEVYLVDCLRRR